MDLSALPSLPFSERGSLPNLAGVYVVTDGDGVVYIGQAKSILHRWRNHHRAVDIVMLPLPRIAWIEEAEEQQRTAIESDMVRRFRPRLNVHGVISVADGADDGRLVGASQAIRELGIPRTSFYRAVNDGRIPVHEVERKPWQKRAVKRFLLSEVMDALGMEQPGRPRKG